MSKTKPTSKVQKAEKVEKKRKRQEEETDDVPKKSKKSKKSEDDQVAAQSDKPIAEQTAVAKEGSSEEKLKTRKERRAEEAAVEKARKKAEKKAKKAEKLEAAKSENKDESAQVTEAATSIQTNGAMQAEADDFIAFPDEVLMPDATEVAELEERKRKKEETRKLKKLERVKAKKEKKSKKADKSKDTSEVDIVPSEDVVSSTQNGVSDEPVAETNGVDDDEKTAKKEAKKAKKEKKEKKEKKSKPDTNGEAVNGEDAADEHPVETNGEAHAEDRNAEDGVETAEPGKKGRFIVFVGNLPYTATKESIAEHFVKVHPIDIRLRTYKGTEKFMGTCFIEFDRFDRMETCLKKYHHSVFADGKKKEGRKINVELSAGGGGNSEVRKSRIVAKNDKLADERVRDREKRAEVEAKQGERKQKKDAKSKKGEVDGAAEEEGDEPEAGMHPARLAMMQQPARPTHRQRF